MMDDSSRGLDIVYEKLSTLGKKAHEKYGCNIFAVIVTDKQARNWPSRRGMIYESPGADGFFESRIKGAKDLIIQELLGFAPFHQSHSSSSRAKSSKGQPEMSDGDRSRSKNMDALNIKAYNSRPLKGALIDNAAKFGLQLNEYGFPWKSLPERCANAGLYIDNYPHGVLSPFGGKGRSVINSISDLRKPEKQAIVDALTTKTAHPMSFVKAQSPDDIKESKVPVLIYEPPPPGSSRKRSKRFFLDGSFDFEGHLQSSVSLIQAAKSKQRVDDDDDESNQRNLIKFEMAPDHTMPTARKRKVDWSELSTPESYEETKRLKKKKHREKKKHLEKKKRLEEKKRLNEVLETTTTTRCSPSGSRNRVSNSQRPDDYVMEMDEPANMSKKLRLSKTDAELEDAVRNVFLPIVQNGLVETFRDVFERRREVFYGEAAGTTSQSSHSPMK